MSGWTRDVNDIDNQVFSRPLGLTEQGFYWDSQFNGTADCLQHSLVRLSNGHQDIFARENVERTWILLKRRYPLLGARLRETSSEDKELIEFVVEETASLKAGSEDVTMGSFNSESEAYAFADNLIQCSARPLSNDLLARLYIFSRSDSPGLHHVVFLLAHLITDGMGNTALARNFLQTLATKPIVFDPSVVDLENQLSLSRSLEEYSPSLKFSVPRQRWRRAIAHTIYANAVAKMRGGHTLPRKFTTSTPFIPGRSRGRTLPFSVITSDAIIANCRKNRITFGHALPIAAQVAHSRVLQRLRQQGRLSEEEWQYRRHQPMYSGGPLNMRPYLDADWLRGGGAEHVCLSINFFNLTLPHMPLGNFNPNGETPYSSMLSQDRFFLRCRLVKAQSLRIFRHPLFVEAAEARAKNRLDVARRAGLYWRNNVHRRDESLRELRDDAKVVPIDGPQWTFCNGSSSMGNMDAIFPREYPIPRTHPMYESLRRTEVLTSPPTDPVSQTPAGSEADTAHAPVIKLIYSATSLHCRPAEFYLTASSSEGQIKLTVFWDGNVFEDALVEEWQDEVLKATEWFLGRGDPSAKL